VNWIKLGNLRSKKVGEWRRLEGCERGYALFSEMRKKSSCSETSMEKIWVQGIIGEMY
jgi:hypothetical protein